MSETVAYKILTAEQWTRFAEDSVFYGAPIDLDDGYIHMSTAGQVRETLDKHFGGQVGLVIAAIDLEPLGELVRWDVSRGGALFPHLYAPLPLACVRAWGPVVREAGGDLVLPA